MPDEPTSPPPAPATPDSPAYAQVTFIGQNARSMVTGEVTDEMLALAAAHLTAQLVARLHARTSGIITIDLLIEGALIRLKEMTPLILPSVRAH